MEFIQVLGLIAGAVIVIVLILWLVNAVYTKQRKRVGSSESISSKKALEICLKDITYKKNVISNLYFPVRSENSLVPDRYRRIEQIVVGSGGVLLLTACKESGKIDNRGEDIWISIKDDERYEFPSPLAALHACTGIVSSILKRSGFRDPAIYEAVVFTDNQSDPVDYSDGVVFMSELERLIKDLNESKIYDSLEQYFIIKAINDAGLTKKQLDKKMNDGEKKK